MEILFSILNSESAGLSLWEESKLKKQSKSSSTTQREMQDFCRTMFNNYMDYFFIHTLRLILTGRTNMETFLKTRYTQLAKMELIF